MKIAVHNAQFSYHLGGTERLIYDQITNLVKYPNMDITLITSKTKSKSPFFEKITNLDLSNLNIVYFDGIETLGIKNPYSSNNPARWHFESYNFGLNAFNFYKEKKFDLVATHFSSDSLFIPPSQKNILHLHGTPLASSELGELSTDRPDAFISVCKEVKNKWIELYPNLKNKRIEVVYPNINHEKFKPNDSEKDVDILFVGRFIKIKGIYDLLQAIKLQESHVNAVLVGNGPEKEGIKKAVKDLNIEERVNILSDIPDQELYEIYNRTKVATFPSYAKEGMVLTMLESASSGAAIVASDACGMPEFIKHYETGILAKPQNPKDLALKIKFLLQNKDLRIKLGNNARKEIVNEWNTKKRIQELYNIYKEIAKNE